jgi:hypothetical protein
VISLHDVTKRKISSPPTGTETRFSDLPVRRVVTVVTDIMVESR